MPRGDRVGGADARRDERSLFDEHFVLRFASSLEWRYTRRDDLIATPEAFSVWLTEFHLPISFGQIGEPELARIHELREALYGLGLTTLLAKPYDPADVAVVNAHAARSPLSLTLDGGANLGLAGDVDGFCSSAARAAIDLFTSATRRNIRQCSDGECTQLFVDRSRNGERRWCCKACSDRAKSAAYRQRRQGHSTTG